MRSVALVALLAVLAACADDGVGTVEPYDPAPVPAVPDRTAPIDPATVAGDGTLTAGVSDGDYWGEAIAVGSGVPFILFDLSQAVFADDAYEVIDEPHGTLSVLWDDLASVTVVTESRQNYAVPGAELASLIGGNAPSGDAPEDYRFVPYPFLLTIRNGQIVEAHQIWVPS